MTKTVTISGAANIEKVGKLLEEGHSFAIKYSGNKLTFKFDESRRPGR